MSLTVVNDRKKCHWLDVYYPVKKGSFCPKTTKFGPKLAFLVKLGQAFQAYLVPCWWVGWWLWRAGCISKDTYLLYILYISRGHYPGNIARAHVARFWEPTHFNPRPGIQTIKSKKIKKKKTNKLKEKIAKNHSKGVLLRDWLLHCRLGDGQRGWNGALWRDPW